MKGEKRKKIVLKFSQGKTKKRGRGGVCVGTMDENERMNLRGFSASFHSLAAAGAKAGVSFREEQKSPGAAGDLDWRAQIKRNHQTGWSDE